jgi:YVTN family beta-propeller protein
MKKNIYEMLVMAALCVVPGLPVAAQSPPPAKPVRTLSVAALFFTADPARHRIYASANAQNEVVAIDTDTLTVLKRIPVGNGPAGMALSVDGTKLYVALAGSEEQQAPLAMAVIDTATLTALANVPIDEPAWQIAAGLGNRLYITSTYGGLYQVDATSGRAEATVDLHTYSDGLLQISPDRKTLYFGDTNISPSTIKRFNVATAKPALEQSLSGSTVGDYGDDLKLSHNGKVLCYSTFGGNRQQPETDEIDPANFTVRYGEFQLNSTPSYLSFSPDDKVLYEYAPMTNTVDFFNTATFAQIGSIYVPNETAAALITDSTGRYLFFAKNQASIEVYDLQGSAPVSLYGTEGEAFSYQVSFSFTNATFTVTGLPAGLSFDSSTHTITGTPTADGVFHVVVTATNGSSAETVEITLTLYPNEQAQNISTRLDVLTGDDVGIAGFIIAGSDDKQVVVRAIGPSLETNGHPLPGRLGNPSLELHDSTGRVIASNDDWLADQNAYLVEQFDLAPPSQYEAALFRLLPPGSYTLVVSGVNATTGIALAEVYDVGNNGESGMGVSRLANISTRGKVLTGNDVMIGGLILGGSADAKILLRALGPSLRSKGVSDPLADPQLDLFDSNGNKIATNDNWKDSQETAIKATGLAPGNNLESAILMTLPPAAYTAVVSGVGGKAGVGLVEAYNLP